MRRICICAFILLSLSAASISAAQVTGRVAVRQGFVTMTISDSSKTKRTLRLWQEEPIYLEENFQSPEHGGIGEVSYTFKSAGASTLNSGAVVVERSVLTWFSKSSALFLVTYGQKNKDIRVVPLANYKQHAYQYGSYYAHDAQGTPLDVVVFRNLDVVIGATGRVFVGVMIGREFRRYPPCRSFDGCGNRANPLYRYLYFNVFSESGLVKTSHEEVDSEGDWGVLKNLANGKFKIVLDENDPQRLKFVAGEYHINDIVVDAQYEVE